MITTLDMFSEYCFPQVEYSMFSPQVLLVLYVILHILTDLFSPCPWNMQMIADDATSTVTLTR